MQLFLRLLRRDAVSLVFIGTAAMLLVSSVAFVQSAAPQITKRSFENKIPPQVPLKVKIKKDKEEKALDVNNKNWFRDIEIEITNTSDKPIYFLSLNLEMPDLVRDDGALAIFPLRYGNSDLYNQDAKPLPGDIPIQPGATYTFVVDEKNRSGYEAWRSKNNRSDPQKLQVSINHLSYGDGTGFTSLSAVPFPVKNNPEELGHCLRKARPPTLSFWPEAPHLVSVSFGGIRSTTPAFEPVNFFERTARNDSDISTSSPDICCPGTSCNKFKLTKYDCVCAANVQTVQTTACSDVQGVCGTQVRIADFCTLDGVGCPQFAFIACAGAVPIPSPTPTPEFTCPSTEPSNCASGIPKDPCRDPIDNGCPPFYHPEGPCCVKDPCVYEPIICPEGTVKLQFPQPSCAQICIYVPQLTEAECLASGFFWSYSGGFCLENLPSVEQDCVNFGWFWNFQSGGCHETQQVCPAHCSPYWPLESGGCESPVDYCDFQWGCGFGFTDGGSGCCCGPTPILVDVAGNSFSLTDAYSGVHFDMGGDGHSEPIAWTKTGTDDAWLVLDRNNNGRIDSSKEMFGNFTEQSRTNQPPNGFLALSEFDKSERGGNGDGVITKNDKVFGLLRLWQDVNQNGWSEPSELHTLQQLGLKAIELTFRESKQIDRYGNKFRYRAKVLDNNNAQMGRWAWDVILQVNPPPRSK